MKYIISLILIIFGSVIIIIYKSGDAPITRSAASKTEQNHSASGNKNPPPEYTNNDDPTRNPEILRPPHLKPGDAVEMVSIHSQNLPDDLKQKTLAASDNLKTKGSFSGGKVTHEFTTSTAFLKERLEKAGGINGVRKKLSYASVDITALMPHMDVVGADGTGVLTEGKGWGTAFYLLNERNGTRRVELSETYLGNNDTAIQTLSENINDYVSAQPATVERLFDESKREIINVHWSIAKRDFSISTLDMGKQETLELAERISQAANELEERAKQPDNGKQTD